MGPRSHACTYRGEPLLFSQAFLRIPSEMMRCSQRYDKWTAQSATRPEDVPGYSSLVSKAFCKGKWSMQTPYRALPRSSIGGEHTVRMREELSPTAAPAVIIADSNIKRHADGDTKRAT